MEKTIENAKAFTDKRNPPCLTVTGQVMTYRGDDKIEVTEGNIGINETILILDILVKEGTGPMKGTLKEFEYVTCENITRFNRVTLRHRGEDVTIEIDAS
jgi:hypothetical protein